MNQLKDVFNTVENNAIPADQSTWVWFVHETYTMLRCVFHRNIGVTSSDRQKQLHNYIEWKIKQMIFMPMKIPQDRDDSVPNREDSNLWTKTPFSDTETSQRQSFHEYELAQDEYLKHLGIKDNIEQTCTQDKLGNKDDRWMSQLYQETKTDKMQRLRREIEFLERGMQRVRARLDRIQQDLLLTPSTSMVGVRPKNW